MREILTLALCLCFMQAKSQHETFTVVYSDQAFCRVSYCYRGGFSEQIEVFLRRKKKVTYLNYTVDTCGYLHVSKYVLRYWRLPRNFFELNDCHDVPYSIRQRKVTLFEIENFEKIKSLVQRNIVPKIVKM